MIESKAGRSLVIWGTSGHARVIADIVRLENRYDISGFLDDFRGTGEDFCGAKVWGGREVLPDLAARGVDAALIAVGDPHVRLALAELATSHGVPLATAIHPRAVVASDVEIGPGSVIMAGAVLNPGVRLGLGAVVNTLASIDHGCVLGDGATVCPGAHLGGDVIVDRCAWIGIGATVRERLRIGADAIVGAGAVVVRDVAARSVVVGVPARVLRTVDAPHA